MNAERRVPSPVSKAENESSWGPLHRVAATAAAVTVILIPIQLATFVVWPPPLDGDAEQWFDLLQQNRFDGLVSLDLLLLIDWLLLIPMYLSFGVLLLRRHPSLVALGLGIWVVAIAAYLASNPAIEMASLSDRYVGATDDAERARLLAAGEALMVSWDGTAFHVSYILGQLAAILVGVAMLRSHVFPRVESWLLVAGSGLGYALYVPRIGVGLSAASGLVLGVWYVLVARTLWRASRSVPAAGVR